MRIFVGLQAIFCIFAAVVLVLSCTAMTRYSSPLPKVTVKEKVIAYTPSKETFFKDPANIALHPQEPPSKRPYKIIGKEIVSRYNRAGVKRQAAILHDQMRSLAASIGGDAVIRIVADKDKVMGTVVSYEKVLI